MNATIKTAIASLAVLALPFAARAQWITQRLNLKAGWNAIHLKVNPSDTSCAKVFADSRIKEVSWWNRDRLNDGTGSMITDFCNWYKDDPEACTFGRVVGDQRYLVRTTADMTLEVVGTPAIPKGTIYLGEYNLVGVNVNNLAAAGNEPTYYEYFQPFYYRTPSWCEVSPQNTMVRLSNSALIKDASKAVWLDAAGSGMATFTGPFLLTLGNADKTVNWTDDATLVRTITVKNTTSEERILHIERDSSLDPPTGERRSAGNVQLLRETIDWSGGFANRVYKQMAFPFTTNLAAGATFNLRLKPDTSRMAATAAGDYMSVLTISDKGSTIGGEKRPDGTCLYRVGVSAAGSLMSQELAAGAGLWVGTVVLAEVNRAKMMSSAEPEWDPDRLVPAPHPFQFRLLVHVDANRTARIVKEVFTAKASPEAATMLLADRDTAVAFRGEYPKGSITRTSSANFPFMSPLALYGGRFMAPGDTISGTFTQAYDDKTNPFVHAFHPQHDNVEFNNQKPTKLASGDEGRGEYESWSVTREISLTFADEDPTGAAGVEWNRSVTGGVYEETVSGLTGQGKPVKTRGIFRLMRVNDVDTLHAGGVLD